MTEKIFDFVFCCLSQDQKKMVETAMESHDSKPVYYAQQNLMREKHGYRCSVCGKFYPYIELDYQDARIDPREYAKSAGDLRKGKKAAVIFGDKYYYAQNKKTLLKFEADSAGTFRETETIPIMGGVCHTIVSYDEKFIATETFGGTIAVIDVSTKQCVAKKQQTNVDGKFIFTQDNKILYFYKDNIKVWDFFKNVEQVVWSVPENLEKCEDPGKQIPIVCTGIIYNRKEQTYIFVCGAREKTYVVFLKDMQLNRVIQLPGMPANGKLVYDEKWNQYTLPTKNNVMIYNSNFQVVEMIVPPHVVKNHDGGGLFPVIRHVSQSPNRTFLSPDGKWLLLDYFTSIILMRREDLSINFCLYSYTGKVAQHMGFVDRNDFWYTWGDTTYIQEIER